MVCESTSVQLRVSSYTQPSRKSSEEMVQRPAKMVSRADVTLIRRFSKMALGKCAPSGSLRLVGLDGGTRASDSAAAQCSNCRARRRLTTVPAIASEAAFREQLAPRFDPRGFETKSHTEIGDKTARRVSP